MRGPFQGIRRYWIGRGRRTGYCSVSYDINKTEDDSESYEVRRHEGYKYRRRHEGCMNTAGGMENVRIFNRENNSRRQ